MNRGKIYLIGDDQSLQPMEEQPYAEETLFQELLEKYPDLLAGEQIDEESPRRWLLISREFGVPGETDGYDRWSLDHLFLDQDGIPTLVEVKRSSDTRIRREVVGQMLDYAANAVVYWPVEKIRATFESACEGRAVDPTQQLQEVLGAEAIDEDAVEAFWGRVKTNLQAQRIRMVFVADDIPPELRRIVEFLNHQMDPAEVLAIEIRQFVGNNVKTLVPRLLGQTATTEQKRRSTRQTRQWDEQSFFQELEARRGKVESLVARRILDWARPRMTRIWWGKGATMGSFIPVLNQSGTDHLFFAVWTYGTVEMYFQWFKSKPPFDSEGLRLQLLSKLNEIPGVSLPPEAITKRPPISLATLAVDGALDRFFSVMEWHLQAVQATKAVAPHDER